MSARLTKDTADRFSKPITVLGLLLTVSGSLFAQSAREIGEQFLGAMDEAYAERDFDAYADLFHDELTYNISVSQQGAPPQTMSLSKSMMLRAVPQAWSVVSNYTIERKDIQVTELENGNLRVENSFTESMIALGTTVTNEAEEVIMLEVTGDRAKAVAIDTISSVRTGTAPQVAALETSPRQSEQRVGERKPGDVVLEPVSLETALGQIDFELGTMFVPENRNDPQSRVIGVGFARFRGTQSTGAPPTFHLPGGPGESFLRSLKAGHPQLPGVLRYVGLFRSVGDVVLVDQRGSSERGEILSVKVSTPARSPDEPLTLDLFRDVTREAVNTAVAESRDAQVDLRGYTVLELADDIDDLRLLLEYDQVSLVGFSFGSQWSLAVMRRHPDIVARALLTGVEPLDRNFDMPSEVYAALQRMWFEAEQQSDLRPYIPRGGLTAVASEILDRLEREPARVTVKANDGEEISLTLGSFDFQRDFLSLAQQPKRLLELWHGQYESWASETAGRALTREVDFELLNSLIDSSLRASADRIALVRGDPATRFLGRLGFDLNLETADAWPSPDVGDEFRAPVETQTPVVFVQGDWDTSTPIENTLALAPFFPNGRVLIVHRGGHGGVMPIAVNLPPVMRQLLAFLESGTTDGLPVEVTMPARNFAPPDFPPPAGL